MKRFDVRITNTALDDLDEIEDYIRGDLNNPTAAVSQYDRITKAILSLAEMPARFPVPQFAPCEEFKLHRMLVDSYSVFFLIEEETVIVTDVLYSRSDLTVRLSERR